MSCELIPEQITRTKPIRGIRAHPLQCRALLEAHEVGADAPKRVVPQRADLQPLSLWTKEAKAVFLYPQDFFALEAGKFRKEQTR